MSNQVVSGLQPLPGPVRASLAAPRTTPETGRRHPAVLTADQLQQGAIAARTAQAIGETTLRALEMRSVGVALHNGATSWLTVAGFADGVAVTAENKVLRTACMMAGHYGGFRFGLEAPLVGYGPSAIAVAGVTAAAVIPQMMAERYGNPLAQVAAPPANTETSQRAAIVGGITGGALAGAMVAVNAKLHRPAAAVPVIALGIVSGIADGIAATTNQRRAQATWTAVGHVAGFGLTAVPSMRQALGAGQARGGMMAVALAPFVVANLDASRHDA